jgi:hypothetical protein
VLTTSPASTRASQAAVAARQTAWADALKLEQAKEVKRLEFAVAADNFIKAVEKRRHDIDAMQVRVRACCDLSVTALRA